MNAAGPLASVSVDLDTLGFYLSIHGEAAVGDGPEDPVYPRAVPRFLELFQEVGVPCTMFVIGQDLARPGVRSVLQAAHAAGAELANHSQRHLYSLADEPRETVEREIARAEEALRALTGVRPVGFRAPGYALSATMLEVLEERGYLYDSSVFPAAPYYLAKAAVMGLLRALGRPSGARLDSPSVLGAPLEPYHPAAGAPYRRGALSLRELPLSVTPLTRTPFFGTGVTALPLAISRLQYRSFRRTPHLNLELHAIDLLDETDGVPAQLSHRQPGLRVPVSRKRERLKAVLKWLRDDRRCTTLAEASAALP